ncbi:4-hydroxybutyrate CoA-transferase [Cuneatibacter sp. NSJ-177]|uniref:acetyl-CoA hydrolase/transferase family protein n=1 Tax=Cuneatibacter sp. NSJ-177 TaxID=2931401 RepID=UPI001FD322D4|nr:acetyl-CoA hydrolase/transferase C-terminal domain-containing protein [Cuneatibacter sp. NSJ-177]MCJ7837512.1 4-hydroxybutyrate CoA-transferase [Cuneatibacter sp. NSJ-177]
MNWRETYEKKKTTMEGLLSYIQDGDGIVVQNGDAATYEVLDALYEHRDDFKNVTVYTVVMSKPLKISLPECNGKVNQVSCFLSRGEREAIAQGSQVGVQLVHLNRLIASRLRDWKPNCALVHVSPPDENGYVSLGTNATGIPETKHTYERILAHVNRNVPYIQGPCSMLHVDELTALVELDATMPVEENRPPTEKDKIVAGHIMERVKDGACLQIGTGGIPTAVGIYLKDKKHLGIHTEMFAETMVDLIRCGAVDNSQKKLIPGKSVFVFSGLTEKHRWIFQNCPEIMETRSFEWVNNPYVIAQNDNALSINSCLAVDLTGQVCAESIGTRQYTGTGGQLDFVRGAQMSKGGQSYITMFSTYTDHEGKERSKIDLTLPLGSAVTTPRTDVQYIVTEYGVADLQDQTIENRAKRLIAIAHPDFRDELTFKAKKAGWMY